MEKSINQNNYEAALKCSDAVQDLRDDLAEMAQTKFDSISKQFEEQLGLIEQESDLLSSRLDQMEAKGYLAGSSCYTELIRLEQDNIRHLQNEYSSLQSSLQEALGNGTIQIH